MWSRRQATIAGPGCTLRFPSSVSWVLSQNGMGMEIGIGLDLDLANLLRNLPPAITSNHQPSSHPAISQPFSPG